MAASSEGGLNMRRFYLKAAIVVGTIALLSSLRLPREFVGGIVAGGALSIVNIRGMVTGIRQMLSVDVPSPKRMLITGIFRLLILSGVIITIAAITTINLVGLLIGFAVVPLMLAVDGLLYARGLKETEDAAPACRDKSH